MRCKGCNTKLEAGVRFCPNCGREVTDYRDDEFYDELEKKERSGSGSILPVIAGILVVCLLVAVGIGFAFKWFSGKNEQETADPSQETPQIEVVDMESDDEDLANVDINAVVDSSCALQGRIKKADNGVYMLKWKGALSIYGMNNSEDYILAKGVKSVYLDDSFLETGLLDAIPANKTVTAVGNIVFRGDSIYLEASEIQDEDGAKLTVKKKDQKEIEKEREEAEKRNEEAKEKEDDKDKKTATSGGYVIAASSDRDLTDSDIAGLSARDLNYAKNEIYARHGRRFASGELQRYFDSKSWYNGTIDPGSFDESVLSAVEKRNVSFLTSAESSKGGYTPGN